MPALASTDVTVVVEERTIQVRQKRNRVKVTFGNGTLTYPAGGVPLPAFSSFGLVRNIDQLNLFDSDDGQGIVWKYDKENHKLRAFILGIDTGAAGAVTLDDFPLDTTGEPLADTLSVSLTDSAGAGVHFLGRLQELSTAKAPPASTLYAEAVGW